MSRVARSRSLILGAVAGLVLALGVGLSVGRAAPSPELPSVPPDELLASAIRAAGSATPLSGTVTTHVDLGLPQLPGGMGDAADPVGVLLADQTFRVWRSPDGIRVAQILPFAERDVVMNATDAWLWDSQRFAAWHMTTPSKGGGEEHGVRSPGDLEALIATALREIRPYADVSIGEPTVVAGHNAYTIVLEPTSTETLVGRIELAIDAETRLPLRIQVEPSGSTEDVLQAGFTSLDLGPVDPAMFSFVPPEGATVKEVAAPEHPGTGKDRADAETAAGMPEVRTFGDGFGLVLAVRVREIPKDARPLFPYAGPLGSASLVDRGDHAWVVVGLVPPEALARVEPNLP